MVDPAIVAAPSASVLGELSVMQCVAWGLPSAESVLSFVCRGLADVPGVSTAHYSAGPNLAAPGQSAKTSTVRFSLEFGSTRHGELLLALTEPAAFAPYLAYIQNLCFVVAIIVENRAQDNFQKRNTARLEQRVRDSDHEAEVSLGKQNALQERLVEAQKLDAIGRLAGGIAHDFNNMLSVILGSTELALLAAHTDEDVHEDLLNIRRAAERSAGLVQQLLAFARQKPIAPKVLNLNERVESILNLLQSTIGDNVRVKWSGEANLRCVRMDPSQVDQLVTNLCINARDAIDGVGTISIATSSVSPERATDQGDSSPATGPLVLLTIADTGHGMDESTMAQIFEPFFSTGPQGESTGLGLATVYGIVKQNGGTIDVASTVGIGSTFSIFLPTVEGAPIQNRKPNVNTESARGGEMLLVVDDDPTLLAVCARLLSRLGYEVLATSSAFEALKLAADHAGTVDLLITDVTMPEMGGLELAAQIKMNNSELNCLFISGYSSSLMDGGGVLPEGVNFIGKPFSGSELSTMVRSILDDEKASH